MASSSDADRSAHGRLRLEVVTPTGVALKEIVDEFTAPSVQGDFGVLPGHLPLLAALRAGVVTYRIGQNTVECAVGAGFVEVAADEALFLTDRYATKESIDIVATRLRLKEIDQTLDAWSEDPGTPKHQEIIAEAQWQATLLELFGDPPPPRIRLFEPYGQRAPSRADIMQATSTELAQSSETPQE